MKEYRPLFPGCIGRWSVCPNCQKCDREDICFIKTNDDKNKDLKEITR